ncbi:retinol-binding protein pinta [Tribolium castaneum]|uniref:Alpha-tocopherol transfer protein-like Protein n=1 Tax=Tribolium castaneum TaxID=7070 RepID=D2A6J1_TRICA|nr:PREDICTED: retinaldehyde-binding protein 1 [Tribolium castaneum]EFA04911.1 Alpha-tocopherol transfer protein-like Protein [Tribolium castaneum]|eukprot:XP_971470.1 PREDICTED: retinaldehyde-binding protein 1 [Tribolium castaneum]
MVELFEKITDEQRLAILAHFGKTAESSKCDVIALKEWCSKQPHLPDVPCDSMLESFLRLSKYNFDKAKSKIDNFYTLRMKMPHLLQIDINPNSTQLRKNADYSYVIKLPQLTDDLYRVTLHKLMTKDLACFNPLLTFLWHFNLAIVGMIEDCNRGYVLIYDFQNYGLSHVTKITPTMVKRASEIYKKTLTASVKSIHFVNCPSIIDHLLTVARVALNPKIVSRIFVHPTLDSLYSHVPRKILPCDYGGEEKSAKELNEIVKAKMWDYKGFFDHLDGLQVDENLRPENLIDDDFLGFYGNFTKLDID